MQELTILKTTLQNLKNFVTAKSNAEALYNNYINRRNSEELILFIDNTYNLYLTAENLRDELLEYLLNYDNSFFNYKKELNYIYQDMKEGFIGLCESAQYIYNQDLDIFLDLSLNDKVTIFYHYLITFLDDLRSGYYDYKINDLSASGFSGKRKDRALRYLVNRVKKELKKWKNVKGFFVIYANLL